MAADPRGGRPIGRLQQGTLAYYESHTREYHASTVGADVRALYPPFLTHLEPGATILDAGCGSGRDTRAFVERGFRLTAIDGSPAMARLASAYAGQPCRVLSFDELAFEQEFDGIWACASLLHVAKRDMAAVLRRFARALTPAGVIYISLRQGDGERVIADGRFFNYYTAGEFRDVVAQVPALREIAFWITAERRSTAQHTPWLNFLLARPLE